MNNDKQTIRVVAAAINHRGTILVAQRPRSEARHKSLKWEFPGGKIEPGETEKEAIMREIREELDCHISVDFLLPEFEYEYPDFILNMTVCICHLKPGSFPKCLEHNCIKWMLPESLHCLDWAAADACCVPLVLDQLKKCQ